MIRSRISLLALTALASSAHAGGMILPVKGVRDVERAGALVAGAEDADSLWLNPAGLAHLASTRSLLVGVTYVNQQVDYARIDSGGNQMEPISNQYPGIGIPTLAAAFIDLVIQLGVRRGCLGQALATLLVVALLVTPVGQRPYEWLALGPTEARPAILIAGRSGWPCSSTLITVPRWVVTETPRIRLRSMSTDSHSRRQASARLDQ